MVVGGWVKATWLPISVLQYYTVVKGMGIRLNKHYPLSQWSFVSRNHEVNTNVAL